MTPRYPNTVVQLSGADGNAFAILARVSRELRRTEGHEVAESFKYEATSGDYDHLLQTCMRWVTVE